MAIARTKFGVRKKDFVKQKVLVSAWTWSVSRPVDEQMPPSALESGHAVAEAAVE